MTVRDQMIPKYWALHIVMAHCIAFYIFYYGPIATRPYHFRHTLYVYKQFFHIAFKCLLQEQTKKSEVNSGLKLRVYVLTKYNDLRRFGM